MEEDRTSELSAGEIVGGRFRIERFLAKGGMGAVLAATDLKTNQKVALKVMRSAFAGDKHLLGRFRREAEVLQKIDHPAVVGVMDAGELPNGNYFIALELLEGETLKAFMNREGRMPLPLLVPMIQGLCGALAAAHDQGVIHRDVKPSNVFLPQQPETSLSLAGAESLVKLVDFGVAKVADARKLTVTGGAVGTFQYMAPEQLRGVSDLDGRADVYAVGVIAYEALAGAHPFKTDAKQHMDVVEMILGGDYPRLRQRRPELPKSLERVVAKAMHHERGLRYQSAKELADELARVTLEFLARETAPAPAMDGATDSGLLPSRRPTVRARAKRPASKEPKAERPETSDSTVGAPGIWKASSAARWIALAVILLALSIGLYLAQ